MRRIGPNMWLMLAICALEWLVILKMGLSIEQVRGRERVGEGNAN